MSVRIVSLIRWLCFSVFWSGLLFACASSEPCEQCPPGERRCSADKRAILFCRMNPATQCWQWNQEPCQGGQVCTKQSIGERCTTPTSCPPPCNLQSKKCDGSNVVQCELDSITGCYRWRTIQQCTGGQVCQANSLTCGESGNNGGNNGGNSGCQVTDPEYEQKCVNSNIHWFDNCGNQGSLITQCAGNTICRGGRCVPNTCQPTNNKTELRCVGAASYWFDNCGNRTELSEQCQPPKSCQKGQCKGGSSGCQVTNPQAQKKCVGNAVYWFDNCGKQGALASQCNAQQSCNNGQCQQNGKNCQPKAQKKCVGSNVHWFDSCGKQGAFIEECKAPKSCSNGKCMGCQVTNPQAQKKCAEGSVYWFDNCGKKSTLAERCGTQNPCKNAACTDKCTASGGSNQCTFGDSRCQGEQVQVCNRDPNTNCTIWGQATPCSAQQTCQGGFCVTKSGGASGSCTTSSAAGSCSSDNDCCNGQRCKNYVVVTGCGCKSNNDCPKMPNGQSTVCCDYIFTKVCKPSCN